MFGVRKAASRLADGFRVEGLEAGFRVLGLGFTF